MSEITNTKSAIIIGAGLVGSLCACILSNKGYRVTLYEKRPDLRTVNNFEGRSINLALSHRGRKALRLVGLENEILNHAMPMKGRFLHKLNGVTKSILYDPVEGQCIYSVGRNFLNATLINAAEKMPHLNIFFEHKLIGVDFETGRITLQNAKSYEVFHDSAEMIIGADGAFSSLRRFMLLTPLFEYSQTYIEHGYIELSVPSERGGLLVENYLHIWPRGEFMMIALPNPNNSWTVTLFMPFKYFEQLSTPNNVVDFFDLTFPDAIPLIGKNELIQTVLEKTPSPLISIKCNPYSVGNKFLIIGDAAHAMVPFYGQGMNCGFEDCTVLDELLNQFDNDVPKTIEAFGESRQINAYAICNLAMYNYIEMRDLVNRPTYLYRKYVDNFMQQIFPNKWIPLYNSISFNTMDYAKCIENRNWQDMVLRRFAVIVILVVLSWAVIMISQFY